jgi:hypothetical protein
MFQEKWVLAEARAFTADIERSNRIAISNGEAFANTSLRIVRPLLASIGECSWLTSLLLIS